MGSSSVLRRGLLCAFVCPPAGLRHLSAHFVLFPPTCSTSFDSPTYTNTQPEQLSANRFLDLFCLARSERRRTPLLRGRSTFLSFLSPRPA